MCRNVHLPGLHLQSSLEASKLVGGTGRCPTGPVPGVECMKRNLPLISCLLLAIVLGLGVGCAKKPDDSKLSAQIQDKFSQDSGLGTKQLAVKAENGVVTLSGTVDTDAQREAAGRQAASVAGVKTVVNNLDVSNIGKPSAVTEMSPAPASPQASRTAESSTPARSTSKPAKAAKSSKSRHD